MDRQDYLHLCDVGPIDAWRFHRKANQDPDAAPYYPDVEYVVRSRYSVKRGDYCVLRTSTASCSAAYP